MHFAVIAKDGRGCGWAGTCTTATKSCSLFWGGHLVKSSQSLHRCATKPLGACIQGKPAAVACSGRCTNITAPVGWDGRTDVGWVVRIVSLILIFHEAPIPSVDGSGLRKEKGISYVQPCSLLPLRASETNSSTIHSVINIGRDPNQFLSRTAINLGPQRWLPHIPISCPGRVQMRASLLCLC